MRRHLIETAAGGAASLPTPRRPGLGAAARDHLAWTVRAGAALVAEGAQSAFHFALNLALLGTVPARDYGLFAVVFTAGSLGLSYAHVLFCIPAAVRFPRCRSARRVAAEDVVLGSVATLFAAGFGCGAGLVLALWSGSAALGAAAAFFSVCWSLRAYARAALFARRRPVDAARADLVFAGSGAVLLGLLLLGAPPDEGTVPRVLALLGIANAFGLLAALPAGPSRLRITLRRSVRRRYRAAWRPLSWSLAGITTANLQGQFLMLLVGTLAGPAAFAPIAAALVLFTPLRLAASALVLLSQPDLAAGLGGGAARDALRRGTLAVAIAGLAYGGALGLGWEVVAGRLFGALRGEPMGLYVGLAGLVTVAYAGSLLPKALMEAGGRFREAALVTLAGAVACVAAVSTVVGTAGLRYGLAGVAAAEIATLVLFWRGAAATLAAATLAAATLAAASRTGPG